MITKACSKCYIIYEINRSNFGNTPSGGFRNTCRSCMAKISKEHNKKSPEKMLHRSMKRREQEKRSLKNYTTVDIDILLVTLNYKCAYCGISIINNYEIDHKIPISRGGFDILNNITLSCIQCNREKHAKTYDEYIEWKRKRPYSGSN